MQPPKPESPKHFEAMRTTLATSCCRPATASDTVVPKFDGQGGSHIAQLDGSGSPPLRAMRRKRAHFSTQSCG